MAEFAAPRGNDDSGGGGGAAGAAGGGAAGATAAASSSMCIKRRICEWEGKGSAASTLNLPDPASAAPARAESAAPARAERSVARRDRSPCRRNLPKEAAGGGGGGVLASGARSQTPPDQRAAAVPARAGELGGARGDGAGGASLDRLRHQHHHDREPQATPRPARLRRQPPVTFTAAAAAASLGRERAPQRRGAPPPVLARVRQFEEKDRQPQHLRRPARENKGGSLDQCRSGGPCQPDGPGGTERALGPPPPSAAREGAAEREGAEEEARNAYNTPARPARPGGRGPYASPLLAVGAGRPAGLPTPRPGAVAAATYVARPRRPPPLPLCPPPAAVSRKAAFREAAGSPTRRPRCLQKSLEYEDVSAVAAGNGVSHGNGSIGSSSGSGAGGCCVQAGKARGTGGLRRSVSQETIYQSLARADNVYEEVDDSVSRTVWHYRPARPAPPKIPPRPPGGVTPRPAAPETVARRNGDNHDPTQLPLHVRKINAIFTAKFGKKRFKRNLPPNPDSATAAAATKDDNSDSESDTEERKKVYRRHLSHVQSVKQASQRHAAQQPLAAGGAATLRGPHALLELFVVVTMGRGRGGLADEEPPASTPRITQIFPKADKLSKEGREMEALLTAIPHFCFPDADDPNAFTPTSDKIQSETFSFVLTSENGTRRFGYCRRVLVGGAGPPVRQVYCIVSHLGCFALFSQILDEVERRRAVSPALLSPFLTSLWEHRRAPPAPGAALVLSTFLPGVGRRRLTLRRPADSRLEHVEAACLLGCLGPRTLVRTFAALLLERRVIFTADRLSVLSKCCHAALALLYPFAWQHTYVPVLPAHMVDIVCSPTPFVVGLLSSTLPRTHDLPMEEVLVVDLGSNQFIRQVDDEDAILPPKLQAALQAALEARLDLGGPGVSQNSLVSEVFIRFFVEAVGHLPLFMAPPSVVTSSTSTSSPSSFSSFRREDFVRAAASKTHRRFLELFTHTQMFSCFVQERAQRQRGARDLFDARVIPFLEEVAADAEAESGVNKFLRSLGNIVNFPLKLLPR
ncbi:LOW QUALITY PROTEIN: DENN domain-containing protein 2B-like [Lethenteron reissneri]|uniref:LOW QUALITY PROTEIN: DENN domain-containing protein 2B-like n=1 Tax=Lethenteron reissneri TaxID=7753 RepID=UPI002AB7C6C6|nr:LOW QUALITY PROTEIN: DENN domain-containing protein 2B-like [Lethenteron reissneri]